MFPDSAPSPRKKIVGVGELLWDLLPSGRQMGGAPANFAYISSLLGNEGIVASRVGADDLGDEALTRLSHLGLDATFVQRDTSHGTGVVKVELDEAGQPKFEIAANVSWDFLDFSESWKKLAAEADAVCFGSLAQRSSQNRATIGKFLRSMRDDAVRIFDVNLRQNFYDNKILKGSMDLANIVKLNHDEMPVVMRDLGLHHVDVFSSSKMLAELYELKLVCVTCGGQGSVLTADATSDVHSGHKVQVADTIGSGDAFTATLVSEYLRGSSLAEMNRASNLVGAWVATCVGAMPVPDSGDIRKEIAKLERRA